MLDDEYLRDVKRVAAALAVIREEPCSVLEACTFWSWRSMEWDAEWLFLPDAEEELLKTVREWHNTLMEKTE